METIKYDGKYYHLVPVDYEGCKGCDFEGPFGCRGRADEELDCIRTYRCILKEVAHGDSC